MVSVVIPTLNEEDGIAECIKQTKNALAELQVYGEIIVSDDSTDRTPEIAEEMGARVVNPDGKGDGYAYLYAFDKIRGQTMAMDDADTTYDFEELPNLFRLWNRARRTWRWDHVSVARSNPGRCPRSTVYLKPVPHDISRFFLRR